MSNHLNENLIERAQEAMAFFEGTGLELAIANNLDSNDLDKVRELVVGAEAEMAREEFARNEIY